MRGSIVAALVLLLLSPSIGAAEGSVGPARVTPALSLSGASVATAETLPAPSVRRGVTLRELRAACVRIGPETADEDTWAGPIMQACLAMAGRLAAGHPASPAEAALDARIITYMSVFLERSLATSDGSAGGSPGRVARRIPGPSRFLMARHLDLPALAGAWQQREVLFSGPKEPEPADE